MIEQLATSPDGQWVVLRRDRRLALLPGAGGPEVAHTELDSDDVDLGIVNGPPNVVIAAARTDGTTRVTLLYPPELEPTARIDLPGSHTLATVSGGRFVMVSADHKELTIIRATGRGLSSHPIDLQGNLVEFVTGIERNQLVVCQPKKLEVWDAVSGRPLRKLALELPPAPRTIHAAAGHLIVTRPNSDEVFVYRLSDGRPFRHYIGAPVEDAIAQLTSPLVVFVTAKGLVRLHCFAHSLFTVNAPWQPGGTLAQLAVGEDISLLGVIAGDELWKIPLGGTTGTPIADEPTAPVDTGLVTAADKLRAMREALPTAQPAPISASVATSAPTSISTRGTANWRDPLAAYGEGAMRGLERELPAIASETELDQLARRHDLHPPARRALTILYATYLVGEPALSLARLAKLAGDWTEALGQGQLAQLALIEKTGGKVRLTTRVTDSLDGVTAS
ncbi:MAG: hypothetical protein QM831_46680 [Kofleriaceae bacterium]